LSVIITKFEIRLNLGHRMFRRKPGPDL